MAIQINPVDFRGFSVGGAGNVNLPNVGALGLQAVQLGMNNQESKRQAALEQARLRQTGELALMQNMLDRDRLNQQAQQFNASQSLDARKLGMAERQMQLEDTFRNKQLGMDERKLGFQERGLGLQEQELNYKIAQDQLKKETLELASKKQEEIDNMGAFAITARTSMDQVNSPSDARTLQLSILDDAEKNGYIDKNTAKQLRNMPISSFKNALDFKILQLNKVKEYQAMSKQNAPEDKGNISLNINPDGSIQYSSKPTPANVTKIQEGISEADEGIRQINKYLNPPDSFFGAAALKQQGTKVREILNVIPGVGPSKEDKEELGKFAEYNSNAKLMIMKTAKAMAGARFSDADLAMIEQIMPQVGAGATKPEFQAKSKMVVNFLNDLKKSKEELLLQGYKVGTPEYDEAISAKLPDMLQNAASPATDIRQQLINKGHAPDAVDAFLRSKGL